MAPSNHIGRDQVGKLILDLPLELWGEDKNASTTA